jgi:hypothetical protein
MNLMFRPFLKYPMFLKYHLNLMFLNPEVPDVPLVPE